MIFILIISALLLISLGIFAIVDPEEYIYLQHFMRFRSVVPEEMYVKYTQVMGGIRIAAGICCIIGIFYV